MSEIRFEKKGISTVLKEFTLKVPLNQRSYSWKEEHVADLFDDIEGAIDRRRGEDSEYFLGTMVFTKGETGTHEVSDGQQRLATTFVLLAAIRDKLLEYNGQDEFVTTVERDHLQSYVVELNDTVPKLRLNVEDNEYFVKRVTSRPCDDRPNIKPSKPSHKRIDTAARLAAARVSSIVNTPRIENQIERLKQWYTFLRDNATVVLVIVSDPGKAFVIFETLNDRGLRLSQVDLLKNYLYGLSAGRLEDVRTSWDNMVGTLEASGYEDDTLDYLRQQRISYHGHIKAAELYDTIKEDVKSPMKAAEYANLLSQDAIAYVALMNPIHPLWDKHTEKTRQAIAVLAKQLHADRIIPLLMSIVRQFDKKNTEASFRLCISWTVRFFIVGGIGSGTVEKFYAATAKQIQEGQLGTAKALAAAMSKHVPQDQKFRDAFSVATVTKNYLARYYLTAMEKQGTRDALLVPETDTDVVDLEHVLPKNPSEAWDMDSETVDAYHKRIGNMALMAKGDNSKIGNGHFADKSAFYKKCPYVLTQSLKDYTDWGPDEIEERQKGLAELAVKTWPITV